MKLKKSLSVFVLLTAVVLVFPLNVSAGRHHSSHNNSYSICTVASCIKDTNHKHNRVNYLAKTFIPCTIASCTKTNNHRHNKIAYGGCNLEACYVDDCNRTNNHRHNGIAYSGHH